jgi:hypothetical protein
LIALDYGNLLTAYGRSAEAEEVFKVLQGEASQAKATSLTAASTLNLAQTLQYQGKWSQSKEDFLAAATLFESASKSQEKEALNNEGVALAGAAHVAYLQRDFSEAQALILRAIQAARLNMSLEKTASSAQRNSLTLSGFYLLAADAFLASNNLADASAMCLKAQEQNESISDPEYRTAARAATGVKLRTQCLISAKGKQPELARTECDESLKILEPLQAASGGKYRSALAESEFMMGLIQEDLQDFAKAVTHFESADKQWVELLGQGQTQYTGQYARTMLYLAIAQYRAGDNASAIMNVRKAAALGEQLPSGPILAAILTESASLLTNLGSSSEAMELLTRRDKLIQSLNTGGASQ